MKTVPEIALAALQGDMARMNSISSNLANALTPGYQRQVVVQQGVPFANRVDGLARDLKVLNDSRAGTLKPTQQPLDIALASSGFFEADTPEGPAYTRAGSLQVDARGRLTTAQGYPIQGKGGEIFVTTQTPQIDAAGVVTDAGRVVGQIKVVRFDNPERMTRLGNGLYQAGSGGAIAPDADIRIRQGFLENSNVSHVSEMVNMMQTLRHFESVQRATQAYDEMLGTAVRKLGEF